MLKQVKEPDQKYVRQRDIIPEEIFGTPITLIGVGAVGGTTAFFLSKTGFYNLRAVDPDIVGLYNLPNSIYRMIDIGKPKVMALFDIIKEFEGKEIFPIHNIWDNELIEKSIICTVDSMKVRHEIWAGIKENASNIDLYIDARMGAEVMRIYAIDPTNHEQKQMYESTLCPPDKVEIAPCTAKATMYCSSIIAGIIVSLLKRTLIEQQTGLGKNKQPPAHEIIYDIMGDLFLTR